jgi:5-methylthioadenosine/S-adenosylhomocysteine deaminase
MCFNPAGYCFDTDGVTGQNREVLERFHQADNGRVKLDVSIHEEYTSFPGLWQDFSAYAAENGLNMHIHLSETRAEHENCIAKYGKTPAAILAENGVFDTRTTAAHCVWLSDEDMDLLREKQVTVAHNPVSNLKLASGIAPVTKMQEKGVRVALGTDGVCSNNNHDLFEEIKLAALLQKGTTGDPRVIPAYDALYMATRAGAFAQGRENQIGQLKAGFDASLILVDTHKPGLYPVHNPVSTLAYSARGGDVYLTMIRGRVLYENGTYTTLDAEAIREKMEPILNRLFNA